MCSKELLNTRIVSYVDIENAYQRIHSYIHKTPCLTSSSFERTYCPGKKVFFKCDNFQKCGSFKIRGALNSLIKLKLDKPDTKAVVTHSSGNFAQALAYGSSLQNLSCYVVCPSNAPRVKKEAAESYGALITECEPTEQAREDAAQKIIDETGAVFIHPYNHVDIIAGQATAGLEMMAQVENIDAVLVPTGGGGLVSGVSAAFKLKMPHVKVYGVEPESANDAKISLDTKTITPNKVYPQTICDGLRTSVKEVTFNHISKFVDDIILVSDDEVASAMRFMFSRMKVVAEPSGVVGVAALMSRTVMEKYFKDCTNIVVLISGGNFDIEKQSHLIF